MDLGISEDICLYETYKDTPVYDTFKYSTVTNCIVVLQEKTLHITLTIDTKLSGVVHIETTCFIDNTYIENVKLRQKVHNRKSTDISFDISLSNVFIKACHECRIVTHFNFGSFPKAITESVYELKNKIRWYTLPCLEENTFEIDDEFSFMYDSVNTSNVETLPELKNFNLLSSTYPNDVEPSPDIECIEKDIIYESKPVLVIRDDEGWFDVYVPQHTVDEFNAVHNTTFSVSNKYKDITNSFYKGPDTSDSNIDGIISIDGTDYIIEKNIS